MKYFGWQVRLGLLLVALSAVLYIINFIIFRDVRDLFFYLSIDTAFLPFEVLLVILVIEQAISEREKSLMLEKLNMVIGAFYSEVGTDLLKYFSDFDPHSDKIRKNLKLTDNWSEKDFLDAGKRIINFDYIIELKRNDFHALFFLETIHEFLIGKRKFLLALLENPNLLEHETFTELLQAVFHLTEELEKREDVRRLPDADYTHLALDTKRAYVRLVHEWLRYMEHLMTNYPYLFSLALRTNPFDPDASVKIQD